MGMRGELTTAHAPPRAQNRVKSCIEIAEPWRVFIVYAYQALLSRSLAPLKPPHLPISARAAPPNTAPFHLAPHVRVCVLWSRILVVPSLYAPLTCSRELRRGKTRRNLAFPR